MLYLLISYFLTTMTTTMTTTTNCVFRYITLI